MRDYRGVDPAAVDEKVRRGRTAIGAKVVLTSGAWGRDYSLAISTCPYLSMRCEEPETGRPSLSGSSN